MSDAVKDTQWFAYWEGIHQAVQYWANKTTMKCPYPTPPEVEENLARLAVEPDA